jgi:hypothetical protein
MENVHAKIPWRLLFWSVQAALLLALLSWFATQLGAAQVMNGSASHPNSIHLPEDSNPPDANDVMLMNQNQIKKRDFDAANALRQKQIDEDTAKLLILAKDFDAQISKLGNKPLPSRLLREAEVIELLAHDVHTKMTLTVGGG